MKNGIINLTITTFLLSLGVTSLLAQTVLSQQQLKLSK
jgi:hypothetical protein